MVGTYGVCLRHVFLQPCAHCRVPIARQGMCLWVCAYCSIDYGPRPLTDRLTDCSLPVSRWLHRLVGSIRPGRSDGHSTDWQVGVSSKDRLPVSIFRTMNCPSFCATTHARRAATLTRRWGDWQRRSGTRWAKTIGSGY